MITDKLRDDEDAAAIENDWKFAAMVLDRFVLMVAILTLIMVAMFTLNMVAMFTLIMVAIPTLTMVTIPTLIMVAIPTFTLLLNRLCLITFTAFTVIATVAVLAAAPHVIVT